MAKRLSQPLTFVGMLLNFWSNASEILWAGSVEIISTLSLVWANWRAILQLKKKRRKGYCFVKLNRTEQNTKLTFWYCTSERTVMSTKSFQRKLDLKKMLAFTQCCCSIDFFVLTIFFSFMIWSLVNYVPTQGSEKKIDFLGQQHSNFTCPVQLLTCLTLWLFLIEDDSPGLLPVGQWSFKSYLPCKKIYILDYRTWIILDVKETSPSLPLTKILRIFNGWKGCNCLITKQQQNMKVDLFCKPEITIWNAKWGHFDH